MWPPMQAKCKGVNPEGEETASTSVPGELSNART